MVKILFAHIKIRNPSIIAPIKAPINTLALIDFQY